MKALVDILHLLLCHKSHSSDPTELTHRNIEDCYYYLEKDLAEGASAPDHQLWETNSYNFISAMGFQTSDEALDFVKKVLTLSQSYNELTERNEFREKFILSILS